MTNVWDDWEPTEEVVLNVQTPEQLKRLEERRLIEESDLALVKSFFNKDESVKDTKTIKDTNASSKSVKNYLVNKKTLIKNKSTI